MQIAIVGLAGSGKTTVFNTLTRGHAETGGFGGMELHVGVVKVPDERLDKLAAMKSSAWLINIARGKLVDERALLGALRDGQIGGAVLDTFREEPLPALSSFYDLSNVIVTPHTAWSSGRVLDRSVDLFCDNLRRFANGELLLNVVDPAAGY